MRKATQYFSLIKSRNNLPYNSINSLTVEPFLFSFSILYFSYCFLVSNILSPPIITSIDLSSLNIISMPSPYLSVETLLYLIILESYRNFSSFSTSYFVVQEYSNQTRAFSSMLRPKYLSCHTSSYKFSVR